MPPKKQKTNRKAKESPKQKLKSDPGALPKRGNITDIGVADWKAVTKVKKCPWFPTPSTAKVKTCTTKNVTKKGRHGSKRRHADHKFERLTRAETCRKENENNPAKNQPSALSNWRTARSRRPLQNWKKELNQSPKGGNRRLCYGQSKVHGQKKKGRHSNTEQTPASGGVRLGTRTKPTEQVKKGP